MQKIDLPEEAKLLGPNSRYCIDGIHKEIVLAHRNYGNTLAFFASHETGNWNIPNTSIRKHLLNPDFDQIHLYIPRAAFEVFDDALKLNLLGLMGVSNRLQVIIIDETPQLKKGVLLALLKGDGQTLAFASNHAGALDLNESWGDVEDHLLVKAEGGDFNVSGDALQTEDLYIQALQDTEKISFKGQLNGEVKKFGKRFWRTIQKHCPDLLEDAMKRKVSNVVYSDRYLYSPEPLALLHSTLDSMPFDFTKDARIEVKALYNADKRYMRYNNSVKSNWEHEEDTSRKLFIEAWFDKIDHFSSVYVSLTDRRNELTHFRSLNIYFENGAQLEVFLDQGFGAWMIADRRLNFPFLETLDYQVAWMEDNIPSQIVKNRDPHEIPVFVKLNAVNN